MKITVSIPDDLWRETHEENEGTSETVQRALRLLQQRKQPTNEPFALAGTNVDMSAIDRRVDELLKGAREIHDLGYRAGILWAERLDWQGFEMLVEGSTPDELARQIAHHFENVDYYGEDTDRDENDPLTGPIDDDTFDKMVSMTGEYQQPGPPEDPISVLACRTGSRAAARAIFDFYQAVLTKLETQASQSGLLAERGPVRAASGDEPKRSPVQTTSRT